MAGARAEPQERGWDAPGVLVLAMASLRDSSRCHSSVRVKPPLRRWGETGRQARGWGNKLQQPELRALRLWNPHLSSFSPLGGRPPGRAGSAEASPSRMYSSALAKGGGGVHLSG